MDHETIIIGAGVAGLGIGWQLAEGGMDVAIVERDTVGSGASTAAAGMLAPVSEVEFEEDDRLELELASLEMYADFVAELEEASGVDVDYQTTGTIIVAIDRDEAEALDRIHRYHDELGLEAHGMKPEEAREREPGLSPNIRGGLFCPGDHQVDPGRLVDAMAQAFERAGGTLVEEAEVERVETEYDSVKGVELAGGERMTASRVVVAAGAWTPDIEGLPDGVLPHVRPVRGEMLECDRGDPSVVDHVVRVPQQTRPNVYLAPKSDGRIVVGATSEERGFDTTPTAGGIYELLRGAWRAVPGIYDEHLLRTWTGFRPVTLDNRPVLGPVDSIDGLWIATGHGRNGILMTPVTARAVSEAILTGSMPDVIAKFAPNEDSL
jgi:glycine oxidase